jgi:hypothetical protein
MGKNGGQRALGQHPGIADHVAQPGVALGGFAGHEIEGIESRPEAVGHSQRLARIPERRSDGGLAGLNDTGKQITVFHDTLLTFQRRGGCHPAQGSKGLRLLSGNSNR